MFSSVVQQVEQNVEGDLGKMFSGAGGANGSSSQGIFGGGFLGDSMGNFNLGGMFGANGNGFAGELFGSILGNSFGILGGIFAGNSDHAQLGNGYANGSNPSTPMISPCGGDVTPTNTHQATAGGPPTLDPRIDQEITSLETLMANFDKYSTNGTMTKADLQKAAYDTSNPDLQKAAQFLLANPDVMQWSVDSHGQQNVNWDHLYNMDQTLQAVKQQYGGGTQTVNGAPPATNVGDGSTGGSTPAGGSTSTGGTGSITTTSDQTDYGQLLANMQQQLNDFAKKASGSTSTDKNTGSTSTSKDYGMASTIKGINGEISDLEKQAKADPANAQVYLEQISEKRQEITALMNIEQEVFQMISEMQKAFHDMSMTAIRNING
ncbi:MAG: hypothetical protein QM723_36015 [Myxococcaceae bacterium]